MKNKEKNGFSRLLLPEMPTVLIGGAAVYGLGLLGKQLSVENALRDAVMAALGLAVSGFFLRREVVDSRLDYDNGEHLMRFWTAVWCSLLFSLACAFLPAGGWPFLAVFVASVSQILLKQSAEIEHKNILFKFLNWRVILGYGLLKFK